MKNKNTFTCFFRFHFLLILLVLEVFNQASAATTSTLRWAADTESGAPYVYYESENLKQMTGFEYDIIQALAKKLEMKPEFVQNSWDGLILGLNNDLYDLAINGIEITEERLKSVNFSEPYYSTYLQIITRKNDNRFQKLSDLNHFKVGTLTGALSEKTLKAQEQIQVLTYESEALALKDLEISRSDAVLFDAPIAKYYAQANPKLQILPAPIGSISYGIAISKKNPELLNKINAALFELQKNGELKKIFERWALWNPSTAQLFNDFSVTRTPPDLYEKFLHQQNSDRSLSEKIQIYNQSLPFLLKGAWQTIKISFLAMLVAVFVGLVLVSMRLYSPRFLQVLAALFIELIRGTPLLLQLFFIFYALPNFGIEISAFAAAVLGLGINYSVQESEIYRSGILSVHKNQIEGAKMLGLNGWQIFWSIKVPQAFKFCLPPMTTDFIALIKDSSLVSVITMVELTKSYSVLSSTYYDYVGFALLTAIIYILIGFPLIVLSKYFEKQIRRK